VSLRRTPIKEGAHSERALVTRRVTFPQDTPHRPPRRRRRRHHNFHASFKHAAKHAPTRDAPGIYIVPTTAALEYRSHTHVSPGDQEHLRGSTNIVVVVGIVVVVVVAKRKRRKRFGLNGSRTVVATMDQKRVYKIVLTGGT